MKTRLLSLSFCFFSLNAFPQGSLTPPPGAPAPTMKTLEQIEPRKEINATNTPGDSGNTFIITQPGSYYLTGNITGAPGKHGISVQADSVTLDLNGFALINGGAAAVRGINFPAVRTNFTIRNGTVRGWIGGGVMAETVRNVLAEKLTLTGNTGSPGIYVGLGSLIKDCIANANGIGFRTPDRSQVISCISTENSGNGFESTSYVSLVDCTSSRNGGNGFLVGGSCSILRCSATRNDLNGISAAGGSTITQCTAGVNLGHGISLTSGASIVADCAVTSNGSSGISVIQSGTIRNCTVQGNTAHGIATGEGSTIIGCTAFSNQQRGISVGDGSSVTGCTSRSNGQDGITTANDCTVSGCTVRRNDSNGITAGDGNTVSECTVAFNGFDGIAVASGCLIRLNNCRENGRLGPAAGIHVATGTQNRIDENNATLSGYWIESENNIIIRNTETASTLHKWDIASFNTVGPVVGGGDPLPTTHPYSNISY